VLRICLLLVALCVNYSTFWCRVNPYLEVVTCVTAAAVVFCFAPRQAAHNGLRLAPKDDRALAFDICFAEHGVGLCAVPVKLLNGELVGFDSHVAYSVLPYVLVIAGDPVSVNLKSSVRSRQTL
jgi:hypothetical protein